MDMDMIINPAKLPDEIKAFKKGIKGGKGDKLESILGDKPISLERFFPDCISDGRIKDAHISKELKELISKHNLTKCKLITSEAIHTAVDIAYNDASRTMKDIGKHEQQKNYALIYIEALLYSFFDKQALPKDAFEKKHKVLCDIWHTSFGDDKLGSYGKAQKIINMAFKYLYCRKKGKMGHFKYCHMPLDSFTLKWFERNVKSEISGENVKTFKINDEYRWSNIGGYGGYEEYALIQKEIENYINNKKGFSLSPLELEFIVWPEIQNHLSAEAFLSRLVDDMYLHGKLPEEECLAKDEIIKMPLEGKYECISNYLQVKKLLNEIKEITAKAE